MSELRPEDIQHLAGDVDAVAIGRVYAEALLNEALAQHQEQETLDELETLLSQIYGRYPDLEEFLSGSAIGRETKAKVIETSFAHRCSDLVFNFLRVLNDHDRLALIRPIVFLYRQELDTRRGRMRVVVRTAVPLDGAHRERLRAELRQAFQHDPVLEENVDPDLLGGLVVRVGDWLYDASVRTRLEKLQDEIIERSSHEIQIGRDRYRTG